MGIIIQQKVRKKKDVLIIMQEAEKLECPLYSKRKMYILGIRCVD